MKRFLVDQFLEWYELARLSWVDNVWRDLFLGNDSFLYAVNIIEADISNTIFPLREKAKFTFITLFFQRNNIRQFRALTLEEALMQWAASIQFLNRQQRKILLKYVHKGKRNPVAVEGLKNVWTTTYGIFHSRLTLHIVKTV